MKDKTIFSLMFGIICVGIFIGLIVVPQFEKIECEENGGIWTRIIDGGCQMDENMCKSAGGIPIDCLENVYKIGHSALKCTPGCHFK